MAGSGGNIISLVDGPISEILEGNDTDDVVAHYITSCSRVIRETVKCTKLAELVAASKSQDNYEACGGIFREIGYDCDLLLIIDLNLHWILTIEKIFNYKKP